ncbi:NAD(P)(+) transhydrogenase (Re/Si-specific) subunit beta [Pontibacter diazotrophicus]|uniref:NAD(P) transhydrogenase subunit beta n=1 Tax=Pontibacter diazotrophicus TaxID=1400979 RepID=A0A3D8LEG4_9BACT|nr:NAD(P)(+) transhydrogenase (Re/Si-specific) subunit beta [Pontibacter diazotrophicus]RDV15332.1 NAD(P)(+) transhydrogenase (Re/Si-specific) subunit beta [Pontibacter diazotrophicus]
MERDLIIKIAYLIASVLFIVGIKMLGKTSTARRGNFISAVAMLIAILVTLLDRQVLSFTEIFVTILVGSVIGTVIAQRVEMTSMPEMVAIFNGFGGAASVLVATSEYWRMAHDAGYSMEVVVGVTIVISVIIGCVTLTGSLVAFGKLKGLINGRAIMFTGQHALNAILFLGALALSVLVVLEPNVELWMMGVLFIALLLGVLVVIPIGGADMPVVISLLNSYSGIAACATGFVLNNQVLIIAGALVGASGIILTQIMCKAMNRSLVNVLLGGFGQTGSAATTDGGEEIVVKEVGVEETAMLFDSASSVIIVPGYGMAVAQAQHIVRELSDMLERRGTSVKFAIHPVAGRMPGHMNVLLAEANVPYDKLIEMDQINDEFANTDIALIIGANDVVNPAARTNPGSPIYGMPVLNADKARTVIVCKRGMSAGYAGIENELFGYPNCLMLFGDAKSSMTKVVGELKELMPA